MTNFKSVTNLVGEFDDRSLQLIGSNALNRSVTYGEIDRGNNLEIVAVSATDKDLSKLHFTQEQIDQIQSNVDRKEYMARKVMEAQEHTIG